MLVGPQRKQHTLELLQKVWPMTHPICEHSTVCKPHRSRRSLCHIHFVVWWHGSFSRRPGTVDRCLGSKRHQSALCMLSPSVAGTLSHDIYSHKARQSMKLTRFFVFAACEGFDSCAPACSSAPLPDSWSVPTQGGCATAREHRRASLSGWDAYASWNPLGSRRFLCQPYV